MKILQLVHKPQRRGAEVFAHQLTQKLRETGHQVEIAYLSPTVGEPELEFAPGDYVLAENPKLSWLERVALLDPGLLLRLRSRVSKLQPDIIQVNGSRTVKYGAFLRRLMPRASWALLYRNIGDPGHWVRDPVRKFFYGKVVLPKMDGIVGVSQTTLERVLDFYGLTVSGRHIPRGVLPEAMVAQRSRLEIRELSQTPADAFVVVLVGRLGPEKRGDRFLRLIAKASQQVGNLKAWVVGDGPERFALQQLTQSLGLQERVFFAGLQKNVADWYQAADLAVLTSDTEGLPGTLLEAGYVGLPCVSTRVGGVAEAVLEGQTGRLFEPEDEAGLARAIIDFAQQPSLRQEFGERAAKRVRRQYGMDGITEQYVEFYQELSHRRRS